MLIVLIPVTIVAIAGWFVWKLHGIVSAVPRHNGDFGAL
jgi:hypothetical protein